jgi:hypothetical protein
MIQSENEFNKLFIKARLDLDIIELKQSCLVLNEHLIKNDLYPKESQITAITNIETIERSSSYNLFMFPLPGFHRLYRLVRKFFNSRHPTTASSANFYIHAWLNVTNKGESIGWHAHNRSTREAGFVGVFYVDNTEQFGTHHRYLNQDGETLYTNDIHPGNGYLSMYREIPGVQHRTFPVTTETPRITIAMFIVPENKIIEPFRFNNYWLPL